MTETERVTRLRAADRLFDSWGVSRVLVTRDGRRTILELPIRSNGVWELMEELARRAPRPPLRTEWVTVDSPTGKALGLSRDQAVHLFDVTDQTYVDRLRDHQAEVFWRVIVQAVDVEMADDRDQPAEGFEDRRKVLREAGITESHAAKIYRDVQVLTKFEEESEDFSSAGPCG